MSPDKELDVLKAKELGTRAQQSRDGTLIFTVSLAFTVLGLSSQAPVVGAASCMLWFRLTGWILLFTSGVLGLFVAKRMSLILFRLSNHFQTRGGNLDDHKEGVLLSKQETRLIKLGISHVWILVLGLTALFIERAMPLIVSMIGR